MVVVKYKDPVTGEWKLASAIVLNNEVPGLDTSIVEYSHMNDNLTAYLKAAEIYTDDNHSMTVMSNYLSADSEGDDPIGPVVTIDEDGTLYVLDETTGRATKASAREGEKTIYNLIPDHVYQWFVKDGDGKVVSSGRLKPTGSVRMLKFLYSGIRNFRDLGGWKCDGGTIKYGLLIRGGFFGDKEADPENRKLAEDIGIKHEVDLRDEATATESPIGKHVHYYCYPISTYYADIVAHLFGGEALHSLLGIGAAHADVQTLGSLHGVVGQLQLADDLAVLGGGGGHTEALVGVNVILTLEAAAGVGGVHGDPVAQGGHGLVSRRAHLDGHTVGRGEDQVGIGVAAGGASGQGQREHQDREGNGENTESGFHGGGSFRGM